MGVGRSPVKVIMMYICSYLKNKSYKAMNGGWQTGGPNANAVGNRLLTSQTR
jgi:hypothetical protein